MLLCANQGSSATIGPGPTVNYHTLALASAWDTEPLTIDPSNLNPLARIRQLVANKLLAITDSAQVAVRSAGVWARGLAMFSFSCISSV